MMRRTIILLLLVAISLQWETSRLKKVMKSLPKSQIKQYIHKVNGPKVPEKGFYGHISVNQNGDDLYFMLYPPRTPVANTPLIIWLSGGPGCASTMAMLFENGPIQMDKNGQPQVNPYSWNDKAWLLFVDQPLGTGFGHSSKRGIPDLEWQLSDDFLVFLTKLYELYPQLDGLRLFITGESYAGHYVPAISHRLYFYNNNQFKVSGIAIGNGWTSPAVQQTAYVDFADKFDLVGGDKELLTKLKPLFDICQKTYGLDPVFAKNMEGDLCDDLFARLSVDPKTGKMRWNYYNYKESCAVDGCYDLTHELTWLADPQVMSEIKASRPYVDCSDDVNNIMSRIDKRTDAGLYVGTLLDKGLPVLAYNGDLDVICNYMSGDAWTSNVNWKSKADFQKASYEKALLPNGTAYGEVKKTENFQFLRFYGAGHLVPHDKPAESLYMINKFAGLI